MAKVPPPSYPPCPEAHPELGPLSLDIQELEPLESPDWVTTGSLAAGGAIFLVSVGFAVLT